MATSIPRETPAAATDISTAVPLTITGQADGAGNCTLKTSAVPLGRRWHVNYVTVTTSGNATAALSMYVNEALPENLLDGTADASSAVAPYVPARIIDQGEQLVFVWSGAAANAKCTVRIERDVESVS